MFISLTITGLKTRFTPTSIKKFKPISPTKIYCTPLAPPAHWVIVSIKNAKHPKTNTLVLTIGHATADTITANVWFTFFSQLYTNPAARPQRAPFKRTVIIVPEH